MTCILMISIKSWILESLISHIFLCVKMWIFSHILWMCMCEIMDVNDCDGPPFEKVPQS